MNQQQNQNKTPSSGLEIRQLTFLAVILAVLLVLVLGGFAVVQFVLPLFDGGSTPPIHDTPGSNLTEDVTTPDPETPGDDQPTWLESLFATIQGWFNGGDTQNPGGNFPGVDPNATYPFASNASVGSVIPQGDGTRLDGSTTNSEYSILVDMKSGKVLASERADERMYPASMTKVMTLLVAVEHLQHESSLQDKITVTEQVQQAMAAQGSSGVLVTPDSVGDVLTVEGMLYAIILASDGVACTEMAIYIAGSEQAFVDMMNQKAADLGLTGTHFTNPTGLHDENHYTTARDMAAIMSYTMQNELCAKIMSTEEFNAPFYWPSGDKYLTYYLKHGYLVERVSQYYGNGSTKPTRLTITAAKTGMTDEAKSCLVSYAEGADGSAYICVTGYAANSMQYIDDHVSLYNKYAK